MGYQPTDRFCEDCKWAKPGPWIFELPPKPVSRWKYAKCLRPVRVPKDPALAMVIRNAARWEKKIKPEENANYCDMERASTLEDACGPHAVHFEPKVR